MSENTCRRPFGGVGEFAIRTGVSCTLGFVYSSRRCMSRHIMHLSISEQTTAVEEMYRTPGIVREYRIVRTRAEFWKMRMTSETYLTGMPYSVEVAVMVSFGFLDLGPYSHSVMMEMRLVRRSRINFVNTSDRALNK